MSVSNNGDTHAIYIGRPSKLLKSFEKRKDLILFGFSASINGVGSLNTVPFNGPLEKAGHC